MKILFDPNHIDQNKMIQYTNGTIYQLINVPIAQYTNGPM